MGPALPDIAPGFGPIFTARAGMADPPYINPLDFPNKETETQ